MKKLNREINVSMILILVTCILFVAIVPRVFYGYSLMVVNNSLIYAIVTLGISIMLGMGGQLSFAGLAFMGFGAYFVANVCTGRLGTTIPTLWALLLAPIFCGLVSFLLGLVLLRLKGTYFTFSTIALVQVSHSFFMNYRPLFGGPDGISGIPSLSIGSFTFKSYNQWFYLLVTILIILSIVVERIRITGFGRSLASIRDNETAALTLGVNVYLTKVIAFTISGMLGALAGALYAMHGNFVASDMFAYNMSTLFIIMAMIGGVNSTFGSIIGSIIITVLPEIFRSLEKYLQLFYGISVIILMVFMPMGLAGLTSQIYKILNSLRRNYVSSNASKEAAK